MSMMTGGKGLQAEINVTPLIDVLLVLLIIFMVIQPMTTRGLHALVPQPPKSQQPESNPQTIVLEITGDAQRGVTYKINNTSLTRSEIKPELTAIYANRADKTMFIRGDADLDFSQIAEVIDQGHQAGVNNIALITPRDKHPN